MSCFLATNIEHNYSEHSSEVETKIKQTCTNTSLIEEQLDEYFILQQQVRNDLLKA